MSSTSSSSTLRRATLAGVALTSALVLLPGAAWALTWKGHTWSVTNGGMAGKCQGSPDNVTVDANGFLHLKISHSGGAWTAAELFTDDNLGFGTYQWQIDGPIDTLEPWVVLGLFPYGPQAGIGADGTNEIDIEYSRWGQANGPNADWTDYPASGSTVGEMTYSFTLNGGTLSTSRFIWTKSSIESFLLLGLVPVGSTDGLVKSWKYAPSNPGTNIPQKALPLGMNLWCFEAPPGSAKEVEIVIRDFQMVPEGTAPGTGGAGGAGGGGGTGGAKASGGANGNGNGGGGGNGNGGSGNNGGRGSVGGSVAGRPGGGPSPSGGSVGSAGSRGTAGSADAGTPAGGQGGTTTPRGTGGAASTGGAPGRGGATGTGGNVVAGTPGTATGGHETTSGGGCAVANPRGLGGVSAWLLALPFLTSVLRRRPRARNARRSR